MKNTYAGSVMNDQGASTGLGKASSIRELENIARQQYGSGWVVRIVRIDIDGDDHSYLGETEVRKFRIR